MLWAAGIRDDFADYDYFIASIGRKTKPIATRLLLLLLRHLPLPERILVALDDSPTKRYTSQGHKLIVFKRLEVQG